MIALVRVGTDTNNRPAMLAPTAAQWWALFTRLINTKLGIQLQIIQARGDYQGSAETHSDGYAIDIRTRGMTPTQIMAVVGLARTFGASATWYRINVGSGPHIHLVVDMGTQPTASAYQTRAVRAGYNGLGTLGRGGADNHPKPTRWTTATEGIKTLTNHLTPLEETMPLTDTDIQRIALAVWRMTMTANGKKAPVIQHLAEMAVDTRTTKLTAVKK